MKKCQITAQMYTLRDYIKNIKDFEDTCQKLSNIGFKSVQLSGWNTEIDIKEIKKIFDDNGLICDSTHHNSDDILYNPKKVIDNLNILGASYEAYPYPSGKTFRTWNQVMDFCKDLNNAGKVFYENGKTLTYHNHHIEFVKVNGEIVLDMIYNNTDPKYLQGEIDTYWVQQGGQSVEAWTAKLKNRLPLFHMKDYGVAYKPNGELDAGFTAEIGQGNIDWPIVTKLAEESGAKWFIIEQDICNRDPFDSLKISYDYISNNLCED